MTEQVSGAALLETAQAFRPRLLAEHERIEAGRRLPDDLARDLARAGFFRIWLPAAYGGLDLTPMEGLAIYEELARAEASVAWCVWNGNTNWTTARLAEVAARELFADPDAIFANSTQAKGQAVVVEGGYRVSGRWSLVSGCQLSAGIALTCVVSDGAAPPPTASGVPETRFMHCATADCTIIDTWTAGGLRGSGSHDVVVQDLFVPARHSSWHTDPLVLPGRGYHSGFRVVPGLGAVALGIARGAIEALVTLGGGKRPERSDRALAEDPRAQAGLAQADALVRAARLYLFDAVGTLWDEVMAGRPGTPEQRAQILQANYHAVEAAVDAVDCVQRLGGATALYTSSLLERAFRDVHAITQHIGVHPRTLERTGKVLFGLEPDPMIRG